MRKQKKLLTVTSIAALLVIGVSMTSFALNGWVEEGGEWFFYDEDGSKAEDRWQKNGNMWYWLDSEEGGAMATDKLVEYGDNTYYVDDNGAMVTNTWVEIENEDQDDENDSAEYDYYYMQANGKAYKSGSTGTTKFKTINGKKYAFDDNGKMLYGWVDGNSNRMTGEDDWAAVSEDVYYCGNWDDGAMKIGWQKIYVHDELEDEYTEHWFHFNSNGKRFYNDGADNIKVKTLNGKKYGFDTRGVMVSEWTLATGSSASVSSWKYYNSPEDGSCVTQSWFKASPPAEDNTFSGVIENIGTSDGPITFDADNAEAEKWYYADSHGNLKANEIARIKGKYYAFSPNGYMLNGLVFMSVDGEGTVTRVYDDSVDSDELDDIMDGTGEYADFEDLAASLYYFGENEDIDGSMKTGTTTIKVGDENHRFMFSSAGGKKGMGKGVSGIANDNSIYKYGKKIKANSTGKYQAVAVNKFSGTGNKVSGSGVTEVRPADLQERASATYTNEDGDTVSYALFDGEDLYLVNTTGDIVKNKSAAKDGNDWYYFVQDGYIKMYTNNKNLTPKKDESGNNVNSIDLSKWKNFKPVSTTD